MWLRVARRVHRRLGDAAVRGEFFRSRGSAREHLDALLALADSLQDGTADDDVGRVRPGARGSIWDWNGVRKTRGKPAEAGKTIYDETTRNPNPKR
jgi:hypothetical protein